MNLASIRQELATLLGGVDGIRVYDSTPDSVDASAARAVAVVIRPGEPYVEYLGAMAGGLAAVHLVLEVLVPRADMRNAQRRIDELLSAGAGESLSILDAIKPLNAPQQLSGAASDLVVAQASGVHDRAVGDVQYLATELQLEVYVTRTGA